MNILKKMIYKKINIKRFVDFYKEEITTLIIENVDKKLKDITIDGKLLVINDCLLEHVEIKNCEILGNLHIQGRYVNVNSNYFNGNKTALNITSIDND